MQFLGYKINTISNIAVGFHLWDTVNWKLYKAFTWDFCMIYSLGATPGNKSVSLPP